MAVAASSQAVSPESYAGGIGAGAVFIGKHLGGGGGLMGAVAEGADRAGWAMCVRSA